MTNVDITDSKIAHKSKKKSRTQALTESLLRDRAERAARKAVRSTTKIERGDFDAFEPTRWRVIAGGDPGHLVKTPMRMGGWFIDCQCCRREFESKGWAYCPTCMELSAEKRRANREALNSFRHATPSGHASSVTTANKASPQKSGTENIEEFPPLYGPADFPTNLIGGYRRGRRLPPGSARTILEFEGGWLFDKRREPAEAA